MERSQREDCLEEPAIQEKAELAIEAVHRWARRMLAADGDSSRARYRVAHTCVAAAADPPSAEQYSGTSPG